MPYERLIEVKNGLLAASKTPRGAELEHFSVFNWPCICP
jgi:hypothetical protein